MKKSRTPEAVKKLSDAELKNAIQHLQDPSWDDDCILRTIARDVFEEDNVMTILALGVPLAVELEERTRIKTESKELTDDVYYKLRSIGLTSDQIMSVLDLIETLK